MKATALSILVSIVYIPIFFITIFIMGYIFFFLSEYIYPFMLGVDDSDSWINLLMKNLIVAYISAALSLTIISGIYKGVNMGIFIIPFIFTIVSIIGEFLYMGFNFDSIVNVISLIFMFGVFFFTSSDILNE